VEQHQTDRIKLLVAEDDEELRAQRKWGLTGVHELFLAEDRASALDSELTGQAMGWKEANLTRTAAALPSTS